MNTLLNFTGILGLSITLGAALSVGTAAAEKAAEQKVFELRTYTATPGNLDRLHARFRDHTTRIFAKHGMKVVAYWTPTDEKKADDTLIYVLEHASLETAQASWQAFIADPEWQQVANASNANGEILAAIEHEYMVATDYSPLQ